MHSDDLSSTWEIVALPSAFSTALSSTCLEHRQCLRPKQELVLRRMTTPNICPNIEQTPGQPLKFSPPRWGVSILRWFCDVMNDPLTTNLKRIDLAMTLHIFSSWAPHLWDWKLMHAHFALPENTGEYFTKVPWKFVRKVPVEDLWGSGIKPKSELLRWASPDLATRRSIWPLEIDSQPTFRNDLGMPDQTDQTEIIDAEETVETATVPFHLPIRPYTGSRSLSLSCSPAVDWLWSMIPEPWDSLLLTEKTKPYFERLATSVRSAYKVRDNVCPPIGNIFEVLKQPPENVRAIILGQEPYHTPFIANGLAFSVGNAFCTIPPSLQNVFKEIARDTGLCCSTDQNKDCDLSRWASRGVFLMNVTLSVQKHKPRSHNAFGWDLFTLAVLEVLKDSKGLVVMLWGREAGRSIERGDGSLVFSQADGHLVLETSHPSPVSVDRGFDGCKHFSRANEFLRANGLSEIDWS